MILMAAGPRQHAAGVLVRVFWLHPSMAEKRKGMWLYTEEIMWWDRKAERFMGQSHSFYNSPLSKELTSTSKGDAPNDLTTSFWVPLSISTTSTLPHPGPGFSMGRHPRHFQTIARVLLFLPSPPPFPLCLPLSFIFCHSFYRFHFCCIAALS